MTRYIQFVEENVDGCGTDVKVMVAIESDLCLTPAYGEQLKVAIAKIKQEWRHDEWNTDEIIAEAMSRVFGHGKWTFVGPDIFVEF